MLTGRESLLRVVGKRRRYLPNRRSLLSTSSSSVQSCLGPSQKDENVKRKSVEETASGGGDLVESVNCPVCGTQLRGLDNTLINSHLDECLAKGSKRKLSQLTLLQFNFSKSKVKVHSNWQNDKGDQVITSDLNRISSCDLIHNVNELASSEEDDNYLHSISLRNNPFASCVEDLVSDVFADNKVPSLPLLSEIERPTYVVKEYFDDHDICDVSIPTSIVGRRYGSRKELDTESRVCLSRDPENVKDPNAIKVLYADCEYDNMLGYIPRELAQYLSPLIDMFYLNFEGSIISVPKDAHAAVPIQIICKNGQIRNQISDANIQDFKSLWRQALHVAELANTNPSGMTRYQRNLVLLIEDVLENNRHLFTTSEISFLEAFKLLPDDSQRLFARLYTRKGPWFRVSNISYPEIADCHLAIKGLLETHYVCSFAWRNEVEDDGVAEVLNILNIDELREVLRMLNKKCDRSTRKQDMIDLLLSSSKNMP